MALPDSPRRHRLQWGMLELLVLLTAASAGFALVPAPLIAICLVVASPFLASIALGCYFRRPGLGACVGAVIECIWIVALLPKVH